MSNTYKYDAAKKLHLDALVWDNHACMPIEVDNEFLSDFSRYKQAGVNVLVVNIGYGDIPLETHFRVLSFMRHWLLQRPDEYTLIDTIADIQQAKKAGTLAIAFDIEGAKPIEGQLSLVEAFYNLGVRWMLIAYNKNNEFGGGCHDDDTGLTKHGEALVREMQRVGMITCCTHTGYKTAHDVLDFADGPVIFSHSNPRALYDHPRNIPDDLIDRCADSGGVIGVNGISTFNGGSANTQNIVASIDYIVDRVGLNHVGLGMDVVVNKSELEGDFAAEPDGTFPEGYGYDATLTTAQPEQIPEITQQLLERGYESADIRKILGENFLRVASQVWRS
ncbi:MAG: dipeptidase [Candidatus Azotimanducaceae bacterium WSBS_2022_MAG_OTU7]